MLGSLPSVLASLSNWTSLYKWSPLKKALEGVGAYDRYAKDVPSFGLMINSGFNNIDADYFDEVVKAYDSVVGGSRYVYQREIASGSILHELDVQDMTALRASVLGDMVGQRSAEKRVPEFIWRATASMKMFFLQSLFAGDGSVSSLPRHSVQISYSTRSRVLAREVQQLLLEFGVVSSICTYENGEKLATLWRAGLFLLERGTGADDTPNTGGM
jgi:hypothetical protein